LGVSGTGEVWALISSMETGGAVVPQCTTMRRSASLIFLAGQYCRCTSSGARISVMRLKEIRSMDLSAMSPPK
jgi:hypothetical protein